MLKNGYYYIPGDVAANYVGYLIVAGYEDSAGTIRKTQYLIQDAGFKWRTVSGTLVAPSFGEWRTGVTTLDLDQGKYVLSFNSAYSIIQISQNNIIVGKKITFNALIQIGTDIPDGGAFASILSGGVAPVANRCDLIAISHASNSTRSIYIPANTGGLIANGASIPTGTWFILGTCTLK